MAPCPVKRKTMSSVLEKSSLKKRKQRDDTSFCLSKQKFPGSNDSKACSIFTKLIDSGVVSDNEPVFYLRRKDKSVMKEGCITRNGVLCQCCSKLFLLSKFEVHAGSSLHRPSANMFLKDGRSVVECQQAAEGGEARSELTRRRSANSISLDGSTAESSLVQMDEANDNICQLCGDGGNLILCDSCPSAYHVECLYLDTVPEGEWHCARCRCGVCRLSIGHESSLDDASSKAAPILSCAQCQVPYHHDCVKEAQQQGREGYWCCSKQCRHVFKKLRKLVGRPFPLERGFLWMLVRSVKQDRDTMAKTAASASLEKKLAGALKILQNSFDPVIDYETGVDLLAQTVFNRKSEVRRLDCSGFYTMLLLKGEQLVSVLTVRIHGRKVAEMPFIATPHEFRQQGMAKALMNALESMLRDVGVYKLMLPSISELLETWKGSFGFKSMSLHERKQVKDMIFLSFPGTTLLQKCLLQSSADVRHPALEAIEERRKLGTLIRFKVKLLPPNKPAASIEPISCY